MGSVNVTVRLDEGIKREFDNFCENVGINITTAFNMFIRATLRNRELPFNVTDNDSSQSKEAILSKVLLAMQEAQKQSVINGTSEMTLDEINEIVKKCRIEMRGCNA
jgi:DNA-damage-inducible protein J